MTTDRSYREARPDAEAAAELRRCAGTHSEPPVVETSARSSADLTDRLPPVTAFDADRYLVDQLIRPLLNLYRVTALASGDTPTGGPVAYVRQRRMAIKEDIRFYADEAQTQEIFRIRARNALDLEGSRYDVFAGDEQIGTMEHRLVASLFRTRWAVQSSGGTTFIAQERYAPLALLRRLIDFVPYGEFIPVPYNFDILLDDRVIGSLNRRLQFRDTYVLDLSGDTERLIDRRLAIALAIGLDTLQNR
jgi:hypothetical protein